MHTSPYVAYVLDILSPFGTISARAMFGGYGIYKDGVIVAIVVNDELYFKVDQSNKAQYEELESEPFTYESHGKRATMSYWKVPAEVLEDKKRLPQWLQQSYEISVQNKKKK